MKQFLIAMLFLGACTLSAQEQKEDVSHSSSPQLQAVDNTTDVVKPLSTETAQEKGKAEKGMAGKEKGSCCSKNSRSSCITKASTTTTAPSQVKVVDNAQKPGAPTNNMAKPVSQRPSAPQQVVQQTRKPTNNQVTQSVQPTSNSRVVQDSEGKR